MTKEERKAYNKRYWKEHKAELYEKRKPYYKKWSEEHKEERAAYIKEYKHGLKEVLKAHGYSVE